MTSMRSHISVSFILLAILFPTITHHATSESEWKIYDLSSRGEEYRIPYKIVNGDVLEITVGGGGSDMIIHLSDTREGMIDITMPRQLVDSILAGEDDVFMVLVDEKDAEYDEVATTNCFRTISIPFHIGDEEIYIVGGGIPEALPTTVPPVHVSTGSGNYSTGQIITIAGCTSLGSHDEEVVLEILNPEGKLYRTMSVTPTIDGSFSTVLHLNGELATNGSYTVKATYAGYTYVPEFPISILIAVVAIGSAVIISRFMNFVHVSRM